MTIFSERFLTFGVLACRVLPLQTSTSLKDDFLTSKDDL